MGECQRVDGVLSACMSRDEAYELWRLGQAIERADMSTRVLGVRAAALLAGGSGDHDAVQWMGVLRSVSALQMYQRSHRGPIDGAGIVRFLLYDERFPRSVAGCAKRMRSALERLPHTSRTTPALDALDAELARAGELTARSDGAVASGEALDEAMDRVQVALAAVTGRITSTFVAAVRAADDTAVGTVAVTEVGAEASR